jgi:hypothetical protein
MQMTNDEIWDIAHKRAGYALAVIADNQINTWAKYPSMDTPRDIIARQIAEAMNDALEQKEKLI